MCCDYFLLSFFINDITIVKTNFTYFNREQRYEVFCSANYF